MAGKYTNQFKCLLILALTIGCTLANASPFKLRKITHRGQAVALNDDGTVLLVDTNRSRRSKLFLSWSDGTIKKVSDIEVSNSAGTYAINQRGDVVALHIGFNKSDGSFIHTVYYFPNNQGAREIISEKVPQYQDPVFHTFSINDSGRITVVHDKSVLVFDGVEKKGEYKFSENTYQIFEAYALSDGRTLINTEQTDGTHAFFIYQLASQLIAVSSAVMPVNAIVMRVFSDGRVLYFDTDDHFYHTSDLTHAPKIFTTKAEKTGQLAAFKDGYTSYQRAVGFGAATKVIGKAKDTLCLLTDAEYPPTHLEEVRDVNVNGDFLVGYETQYVVRLVGNIFSAPDRCTTNKPKIIGVCEKSFKSSVVGETVYETQTVPLPNNTTCQIRMQVKDAHGKKVSQIQVGVFAADTFNSSPKVLTQVQSLSAGRDNILTFPYLSKNAYTIVSPYRSSHYRSTRFIMTGIDFQYGDPG